MPGFDAVIRRHLQCRLWIAEMNADIILLRIFDDHFAALSSRKKSPEARKALEVFSKQFSESRREIDELKHEMHLVKMKLAASLKLPEPAGTTDVPTNHSGLEKRYKAFRKTFDKLKNDFVDFEPEQ